MLPSGQNGSPPLKASEKTIFNEVSVTILPTRPAIPTPSLELYIYIYFPFWLSNGDVRVLLISVDVLCCLPEILCKFFKLLLNPTNECINGFCSVYFHKGYHLLPFAPWAHYPPSLRDAWGWAWALFVSFSAISLKRREGIMNSLVGKMVT